MSANDSTYNDLLALENDVDIEVIGSLLQGRFENGSYYTGIGDILVTVNPYEKLDELRTKNYGLIKMYSACEGNIYSLNPHPYRSSELSLREIRNDTSKNVTIIITGESGAGKTVTARMIVDYYTSVSCISGKGRLIEQKVSEAGVIMEYFGNAQSQRSFNSSRFAKVTLIFFDAGCNMVGSSNQVHMLEKSRVTNRDELERNFHCFYAMLAGMSDEEKKKYHLKDANFYRITRLNKKSPLHDMIDDVARYRSYNMALNILGYKTGLIDAYNRILSAILWIGNIEYTEVTENSVKIQNPEALNFAAEMLMVPPEHLNDILINNIISIKSKYEVTRSPYNKEKAILFRDILLRTIYDGLFNIVVSHLNELTVPNSSYKVYVRIVDAFGFESFRTNSLEQFCINHANENLHNNFINVVIKNELEVFRNEGMGDIDIEVSSDGAYHKLMEDKITGIFSKIDEQCRLAKSTDIELIKMIKKDNTGNRCFYAPINSDHNFGIKHFAMDVNYDIRGFIEKSRIKINDSILDFVQKSNLPILKSLFIHDDSFKVKYSSLGYRFCRQLSGLLGDVEKTKVFYIKCIRSNQTCAKLLYDSDVVMSQLSISGIYQALKLKSKMLPNKIFYRNMYDDYYMLLPYDDRIDPRSNHKETSIKILKAANLLDKVKLGNTLLLMDVVSGAKLYDIRADVITKAVLVFQKHYKMNKVRLDYIVKKKAAITIQAAAIGMMVRKSIVVMHARATVIQSVWRGILERRVYKNMILMREKEAREKLRLISEMEKKKALEKEKEAAALAAKKRDSSAIPKISTQPIPTEKKKEQIPLTPDSIKSGGSDNANKANNMLELAKVSSELISTLSSALSITRSNESANKTNTILSKSITLGIRNNRSTLGDMLLVDLSDMDAKSDKTQLYHYVSEYVSDRKTVSHCGMKDFLVKNKRTSMCPSSSVVLSPSNSISSVPILKAIVSSPELSNLAVQVFKNLLKFSSSSVNSKTLSLISFILDIGIKYPQLRDEIYIQIIRQTNIDVTLYDSMPKPLLITLSNYWYVCYVVCNAFAPTMSLLKYAVSHIYRSSEHLSRVDSELSKYVKSCALVVKKLFTIGSRKLNFSLNEIKYLDMGVTPLELRISLLGGASVKFRVYSHSLISEIISYIFIKLGLRSKAKWGLYINYKNMLIALNSEGYIHDEINSVIKYYNPSGKVTIDDIDYRNIVIIFKKLNFDEHIEIVNTVFSRAIMHQIAESLWYNSLFIDSRLCMELIGLLMSYEANDTGIYLTDTNQFTQKLRSRLPSKLLSNFKDQDFDYVYDIYKVNVKIQKELTMRYFLSLGLEKNVVGSLLFYGIYKETNESCILSISHLGISIISCKDRSFISIIKASSLLCYDGDEGHLYLRSIVGDITKDSEIVPTLKMECIETYNATVMADRLGDMIINSNDSLNLLRRVYNFGNDELESDLEKIKESLIKDKIVRTCTIDEEKQYGQFINCNKLQRSAKTMSYRNVRFSSIFPQNKSQKLQYNDIDSVFDVTNIDNARSNVGTGPYDLIWIYYPMDLKIPIMSGRVPATWTSELWKFIVSLENMDKWVENSIETFIRLCYGAPQSYVDEFYLVLSKATSGPVINKDAHKNAHLFRIWTLYSMGVHYFGPSSILYDYVHTHIRYHCKKYLNMKDDRLKKLVLLVNQCRKNIFPSAAKHRKHAPNTTELSYVATLGQVTVVLRFFSIENPIIVSVKPTTTFNKLTTIVLEKYSIRSMGTCSYAIYLMNNGELSMSIPDNYVCDDIFNNEEEGPDSKNKKYLLIRRTCQVENISEIKVVEEKYYYILQIISDICNGLLPVPTILNFSKIVAYLVQYSHGDYSLSTSEHIYEQAFEKYIPSSLRNSDDNVDGITPSHIREWHMALTRVTPQTATNKIALMISNWKLHNGVMFKATQLDEDSSSEKDCNIILCPSEILVNPSSDGIECDKRISLCDVNNIFESEKGVIIVYSDNGIYSRIVFNTDRHFELSRIAQALIEGQ